MREILQVKEPNAKHNHTQPLLYLGGTVREVEPFERAAAGRDMDDDTPKAWFELPHPQRVLVSGLFSLMGICWLLWRVLQPGR